MSSPLDREKKELLLKLLEEGTVMVHLDARVPGVIVPERFRQDPHLRLNLDYAFRIPDFEIRDTEVFASLSFSQKPYPCTLPFSSIWGMSSIRTGQNVIFPASVPAEVWQSISILEGNKENKAPSQQQKEKPLVQLVPSASEGDAKEPEDEPPSPPRRGHLRLVKS